MLFTSQLIKFRFRTNVTLHCYYIMHGILLFWGPAIENSKLYLKNKITRCIDYISLAFWSKENSKMAFISASKKRGDLILWGCPLLTVLYCVCTGGYCTVLYCTVLYCTVLYCTELYSVYSIFLTTRIYIWGPVQCIVVSTVSVHYTVLSTVLSYTVLYCI